MLRLSLLALALVFTAPGLAPQPADAAQTKVEKKKKASKGRSDYSAEERKKIMERAREVCRKAEGAPSRVYRIDYKKKLVYCMPASAG